MKARTDRQRPNFTPFVADLPGMVQNPARIACANCDALHRLTPDGAATRTRCVRCHHLLTLGRSEAIARVVGLAVTSLILMGLVLLTPFLTLDAGPFGSTASVIDVVMGFSGGIMAPLAVAVLVFIVVLPALRALLAIYALAPLLVGTRNLPGAEGALRWTFALKPWAMAEIFMVGVAVALVKLAGMARVEMGTAFWAFALFVLIAAFQDTFMCRHTLWTALAENRHRSDGRGGASSARAEAARS